MNPPLLLAGADVFGLVVVVVVSVLSVLGHLANGMKKPPAPPVLPPGRQPGNAPAPQKPSGELSDEIDAFLRKVLKGQEDAPSKGPRGARPASSRPRSNRSPPDSAPTGAPVIGGGSASRAASGSKSTVATRDRRAVVGVGPDGGAVAQEVERVSRQASSLGETMDQADARAEERMHDTFDHKLGDLADEARPDAAADKGQAVSRSDAAPQAHSQAAPTGFVDDIYQWLADPQDIRKAIVLTEIFNPPSDRW